jgi:hypothetical protein
MNGKAETECEEAAKINNATCETSPVPQVTSFGGRSQFVAHVSRKGGTPLVVTSRAMDNPANQQP